MLNSSSISNSDLLKKLALRCALFFAPLLAILIFATAMLQRVGELMTPSEIADLQEHSQALYDPMYQPKLIYPAYKLVVAARRRPGILILGSSRVLSIRHEFVSAASGAFYNAALYGRFGVGVLRQFLMRLPQDHLPQVLLVDIDPWWFGQGSRVQPDADFFQPPSRMEVIDFAWRNGLRVGTRQRQFLARPSTLVGISAKIDNSGVRADGSFSAARRFFDSNPPLLREQLTVIREDPGGPLDLSRPAVNELREFLSYCNSRHIAVTGYLSSIYPVSYDAMKRNPRLAYYWHVGPDLAPLFQEHGYALFDLQNSATAGCTAGEYLDTFHEAEPCTVRLLITMAKQNASVGRFFDAEKLQGFLEQRRSDWQLGF
jgi:hypothetical protein